MCLSVCLCRFVSWIVYVCEMHAFTSACWARGKGVVRRGRCRVKTYLHSSMQNGIRWCKQTSHYPVFFSFFFFSLIIAFRVERLTFFCCWNVSRNEKLKDYLTYFLRKLRGCSSPVRGTKAGVLGYVSKKNQHIWLHWCVCACGLVFWLGHFCLWITLVVILWSVEVKTITPQA